MYPRAKPLRSHGWSHTMPGEPARFFEDFGPVQAPFSLCLKKLNIHNVNTGASYSLGPYKVRRQSCWDRTGALTGPVVCRVLWASYGPLMGPAWPGTVLATDRTSNFMRHPYGPTRYLHMRLMVPAYAPHGTLKGIHLGFWNPMAKMS